MAEEKLNNYEAKRLIKHMILAANNQEEHLTVKQELNRQMNKIKNVSVAKSNKLEIKKELEKLEEKLNEVLEKEGKLMFTAQFENTVSQDLKKEIQKLESQVSDLKEKDTDIIDSLKDEISLIKQSYQYERSINRLELENTSKAIIELRERIKKFIESREEREKKMEEIESKIKDRVGKNYGEILRVEKLIKDMEQRYDLIRKQGKYDRSILEEFEEKIRTLKQRLIMKKAGIPEKGFVPEIRIKEQPSLIITKETIPLRKRLFVRHDMQIKPVEELKMPHELPPLPPMPGKVNLNLGDLSALPPPPSPIMNSGSDLDFSGKKPKMMSRLFRKK